MKYCYTYSAGRDTSRNCIDHFINFRFGQTMIECVAPPGDTCFLKEMCSFSVYFYSTHYAVLLLLLLHWCNPEMLWFQDIYRGM